MDITESLKEIIKASPTAPFLFIGSGFSRRYLDLEDWEGLLTRFGDNLSTGFVKYASESNDNLALAAQNMASAYSEYWWKLPQAKVISKSPNWYKHITAPLRYDVCEYLKNIPLGVKSLQDELEILISEKTVIDGVITTNWDLLLEDIFPTYKVYVGQSNLLFSNPQKIAKNLIFVNRAKGSGDSISETQLRFLDNKSIPITQVKTDDFSKVYLAFQGKERKIPAHILRIFREQFYQIVQGESPEKKLYCPTDIEEIIKSGGDIEFVAGFGVAKERYSKVGLKGVDFKMILSDAIYGDIEFDRAQILNDTLSDICKSAVYVPIQRFIKADPNFKPLKNAPENFKNLFNFNEKIFVSKVSSGYRKSYKTKNLASINIIEIIENTQFSDSIRADYLSQYIVDNNSEDNLRVLVDYLKEKFEESWNNSNYKRLVCIYDCLVNK